jgi:hypothetical protein
LAYTRRPAILTCDDRSHCTAGNAGDKTPGGLSDRARGGSTLLVQGLTLPFLINRSKLFEMTSFNMEPEDIAADKKKVESFTSLICRIYFYYLIE